MNLRHRSWRRALLVCGGMAAAALAFANPCPFDATGTVRLPIRGYVVSGSDSIADGCGIDSGGTLEETGTLVVVAGAVLGSAAGGTLLVDPGAVLLNNGTTEMGGSTTNNGSIVNSSNFVTSIGSSFTSSGSIDNRGALGFTLGTLSNSGGITNRSSGTLTIGLSGAVNNGSIANDGTFAVAGIASFAASLANAGAGSITNNAAGLFLVQMNATFTNDARFENAGRTNNVFAVIVNAGGGDMANSGIFLNQGTLNTLGGSSFANQAGGQFTNTATVDAAGAFDNAGLFSNSGGVTLRAGALFTNGGRFDNSGTVGTELGATFNVSGTLDNVGAYNNGGTLAIGGSGNLSNSGTLTNTAATIRNNGGLDNSGILLNQFGGQLQNGGALTNSGVVTNDALVSNGGTLDNSGTVNNNGVLNNIVGTFTNRKDATVNNHAGATIVNTADGRIDNAGSIVNDGSIENAGTVNVAGTISGGGSYVQTAGLTKLHGGSITQSFIDLQGGRLLGAGRLAGSVHVAAGATLGPGDPNHQDITGALTVDGGTLLFQVVGTGSGQFDTLAVSGPLALHGGVVEFDFLNGFTPTAGDSFADFLVAGGISGLGSVSYRFVGVAADAAFRVDGSDALTLVALAPVDEPQGWALLAAGLPLIGFLARRRRQVGD